MPRPQLDPEKMLIQARDVIEKHELVYLNEIPLFVDWGEASMYTHKIHVDEQVKQLLSNNRVRKKIELRKKLVETNSPSGLIAVYKLIGDKEDREALGCVSRTQDDPTNNTPINVGFDDQQQDSEQS